MSLEGRLQEALSRSAFKILERVLLTGRCVSLLLGSAHQEHMAPMMPHGPEGAAANKMATASGIRGALRPCHLSAHLSGCTGPGHVET